jgi:DNA polymerase-4
VGIAPVKMVAKIASAAAKPDGLVEVQPGDVARFLAPLPVRRIWGVGPVAEKRLVEHGLRTLDDLARADPRTVERLFGAWGTGVAGLARGEDLREVEAVGAALSYSEENTFRDDVDDRALLDATILTHADSVARRLRNDGVRGRTVVLKWREARRRSAGPRGYPLHTRRVTRFEATDDGAVIAREARRLLAESGPEEPVRLVGVGVSGIEEAGPAQLSLFADGSEQARGPEERAALNRALDELEVRFGAGTVVRASQGRAERAGLSMQIKRGEGPVEDR